MISGSVLLVIPAYEESARLASCLDDLLPLIEKDKKIKVLVVDDGSKEMEFQKMESLISDYGKKFDNMVPILRLEKNTGKGSAIRAGWSSRAKKYEWLGFIDADGAVPSYEVVRMINSAREIPEHNYFGTRIKMLGKKIERSLCRHLAGRVFATLASECLRLPVYDSQCGYKLVRSSDYSAVKDTLEEDGFAFDVELLVALNDSDCSVIEYPIDWIDQPGSKIHYLRDALRMALSIIQIRSRRNK